MLIWLIKKEILNNMKKEFQFKKWGFQSVICGSLKNLSSVVIPDKFCNKLLFNLSESSTIRVELSVRFYISCISMGCASMCQWILS